MPDPIRIRSRSGWKYWPEAVRMILAHRLASGPDRFGQNLTQSARTKPSGSELVLHNIIRDVCGRTKTESESGKLVAVRLRPARNRARWFLLTGLLSDQMRLAKPWPGHPKIRSGSVLHSMIHAFFEKTELKRMRKSDPAYTIRPNSGWTLAVTAITGRNQNASGSDPACWLGGYCRQTVFYPRDSQTPCFPACRDLAETAKTLQKSRRLQEWLMVAK